MSNLKSLEVRLTPPSGFSENVNYFHHFFGIFYISLLQRNEWRQHKTDDASIF